MAEAKQGSEATTASLQDLLRTLPAVATVLERAPVRVRVEEHGLAAVTRAVRLSIERTRTALLAGEDVETTIDVVALDEILLAPSSLRPAVNATGIMVHTNLGRAPLAAEAMAAVAAIGRSYCTVEYDTDAGGRGDRHQHATALLRELTGAEDAAVVNNCAAAVLLALAAVARDRDVVVSRGELIEIGGGFRVPEVMAQSGARLVEVGTTNRTWLRDYETAISEATAALLQVHRSNFEMLGFTHEVELADLAALARANNLPLIVDAGSGCLRAIEGAPAERTVASLLEAGADLVLFSGDKLLGGPQAGIIVGRRALVAKLRAHPLMRALRPDKLGLAALVATLKLWRDRPHSVPLWSMATMPLADLKTRGEALLRAVENTVKHAGLKARLRKTRAAFGGGTTPSAGRESIALALAEAPGTIERWAARLLEANPPIVARIEKGELLFDLLTLRPGEEQHLLATLTAITSTVE